MSLKPVRCRFSSLPNLRRSDLAAVEIGIRLLNGRAVEDGIFGLDRSLKTPELHLSEDISLDTRAASGSRRCSPSGSSMKSFPELQACRV